MLPRFGIQDSRKSMRRKNMDNLIINTSDNRGLKQNKNEIIVKNVAKYLTKTNYVLFEPCH